MHDNKTSVRLFLCSEGRDGGTLDEPTFNIPDIANLKNGLQDVYLTVERFHVESSLTDDHETMIMQLISHPVTNQYDSVLKRSGSIIAVLGNNQPPAVYRSLGASPLERIAIANPLNGQMTLKVSALRTTVVASFVSTSVSDADLAADRIPVQPKFYENVITGTPVVYSIGFQSGTQPLGGLTDEVVYYVIKSATLNRIQLASTPAGTALPLSAGSRSGTHSLTASMKSAYERPYEVDPSGAAIETRLKKFYAVIRLDYCPCGL